MFNVKDPVLIGTDYVIILTNSALTYYQGM